MVLGYQFGLAAYYIWHYLLVQDYVVFYIWGIMVHEAITAVPK